MPLEVANFISQLVPANPLGSDQKLQGDDHLRLIKQVLQNTFPGASSAITFGGWHSKVDQVDTKTGTYTLDATDDGKALFFNITSAATLNLLAAATAGSGFVVFVQKNDAAADLTIDGAASETINGQTTIFMTTNEGGLLYCTGTAWIFIGMASSLFTGVRRIRQQQNDSLAYPGLIHQRVRTGTPVANDLGVTLQAEHKDASGNVDAVGRFGWMMTNVTNGAESMRWYLENIDAGAIATADRMWKGKGWFADGLTDPGQGIFNGKDIYRNNSSMFPRGYIEPYGLQLVNNAGTPNNLLDISAGCATDDTNTLMMTLTATIVKNLDAAWAVGSGNGGLDSGSSTNSTWYHVWLIRRPDTGVVDVLFSLSATTPTMPGSYTQKRRIGAIFNDASGNIRGFVHKGNRFMWKTPPALDINVTNLGTAATLYTLSVPTGVSVEAIINAQFPDVAAQIIYLSDPALDDVAPGNEATPLGMAFNVAAHGHQGDFGMLFIQTNTSAQIRARSTAANTDFLAVALGWIDPRQ